MAQNQKLRDQIQEHAQYLNALKAQIDQITNRLAKYGEVMAALVAHLGEDVVQTKMEDLKIQRRQNHEAELEKGVQFMLDNGLAALAGENAVIDPNSFIVGDEVSADGSKVRIQHEMKRLDKEGQARYVGKKVGDEVTMPGFPTKIVIRQIFAIDMVKVQEYAAKKKAEAAIVAPSRP